MSMCSAITAYPWVGVTPEVNVFHVCGIACVLVAGWKIVVTGSVKLATALVALVQLFKTVMRLYTEVMKAVDFIKSLFQKFNTPLPTGVREPSGKCFVSTYTSPMPPPPSAMDVVDPSGKTFKSVSTSPALPTDVAKSPKEEETATDTILKPKAVVAEPHVKTTIDSILKPKAVVAELPEEEETATDTILKPKAVVAEPPVKTTMDPMLNIEPHVKIILAIPLQVVAVSPATLQCSAMTLKGKGPRCSRRAAAGCGPYCKQHFGMFK